MRSSEYYHKNTWDRQVQAHRAEPDQNAPKGKEHSDQGLHCLPLHSIFWTHTCIAKPNHTIFRTIIMVNIVGVAIFRIFMIHAYTINNGDEQSI